MRMMYETRIPEFGQICIARMKDTYMKGEYGGYISYCKKYKMLHYTEYTSSVNKLVKMETPVKSVVWVMDTVFWTKN